MDAMSRIERSLNQALSRADIAHAPPNLAAAMRYAVFPGGARVRPRLCLAVARACGDDRPESASAAAAAIELLHCASLVHDDLPCFDDAATRRGRASVHCAFGQSVAVLTGDALIVLAFQVIARAEDMLPRRLAPLLLTVTRALGAPHGIIAGQAWECESRIDLAQYQRAKTGALFAGATAAGGCAAGCDGGDWHALGERLGEAYQIADDLSDVMAEPAEIGKPVRRDLALGRPNAVHQLGMDAAVKRLESLVQAAVDSIPNCIGAAELKAQVISESRRLLPRELARPAA
jgi:geranylgeranyl diphosphate synthase, type II